MGRILGPAVLVWLFRLLLEFLDLMLLLGRTMLVANRKFRLVLASLNLVKL